jgi:hypothetical protein
LPPDVFMHILEQTPAIVLVMRDKEQQTPLHIACKSTLSTRIIQQMVQTNKDALFLQTNKGETPLHLACCSYRPSRAKIRYLCREMPVACLTLDYEGNLPLDTARQLEGAAILVDLLEDLTIDTVCALCECRSLLPPGVRNHLHMTIAAAYINEEQAGMVASIRPLLQEQPELTRTLVQNEDLQQVLAGRHYQNLIGGIVRMNQSGRNYIQVDPGDKLKGAHVLGSVYDNLNGLFLHLRENAALCNRNE